MQYHKRIAASFSALGVFTPLMRNHSATGTREQECYQFENIEDFRAVINTRYRLVPYLYSEYMKAALNDDMYFKPLGLFIRMTRLSKQYRGSADARKRDYDCSGLRPECQEAVMFICRKK